MSVTLRDVARESGSPYLLTLREGERLLRLADQFRDMGEPAVAKGLYRRAEDARRSAAAMIVPNYAQPAALGTGDAR